MVIMRGVIQSLNSLTKKIGPSYAQPPPPLVVLDSLKPQNSEISKVDRYIAPLRRDSEFGQASKGKEIVESPKVVGARLNQFAPKVSQLGPSSVQNT